MKKVKSLACNLFVIYLYVLWMRLKKKLNMYAMCKLPLKTEINRINRAVVLFVGPLLSVNICLCMYINKPLQIILTKATKCWYYHAILQHYNHVCIWQIKWNRLVISVCGKKLYPNEWTKRTQEVEQQWKKTSKICKSCKQLAGQKQCNNATPSDVQSESMQSLLAANC